MTSTPRVGSRNSTTEKRPHRWLQAPPHERLRALLHRCPADFLHLLHSLAPHRSRLSLQAHLLVSSTRMQDRMTTTGAEYCTAAAQARAAERTRDPSGRFSRRPPLTRHEAVLSTPLPPLRADFEMKGYTALAVMSHSQITTGRGIDIGPEALLHHGEGASCEPPQVKART